MSRSLLARRLVYHSRLPGRTSFASASQSRSREFATKATAWKGFAAVSAIASAYPWRFSACFSCFKAAAADLFAQTQVEGTALQDLDLPRFGAFAAFGLLYIGTIQYFLLVHILAKRVFPSAGAFAAKSFREKLRDGPGARRLLGQVTFDMTVHMPFIYFPFYYSIRETIFRHEEIREAGVAAFSKSVQTGLQKYVANFREDMLVCLSIWVPIDIVVYGCLPLHFRIPALASIGFVYNVLLSHMRGANATAVEEDEGEEEEECQETTVHALTLTQD